jgi:hypothetical protein
MHSQNFVAVLWQTLSGKVGQALLLIGSLPLHRSLLCVASAGDANKEGTSAAPKTAATACLSALRREMVPAAIPLASSSKEPSPLVMRFSRPIIWSILSTEKAGCCSTPPI